MGFQGSLNYKGIIFMHSDSIMCNILDYICKFVGTADYYSSFMTADSLACAHVTCLVISFFLLKFGHKLCLMIIFPKTHIIMSLHFYIT
jgi:hypothetical protein